MTLKSRCRVRSAAGAALLVLILSSPARAMPDGGADCDAAVHDALAESARRGVEAEVAIVRHPEQGIRNPESILDFSCVAQMFDFRRFDILFDSGQDMASLLGALQRQVCSVAQRAYQRTVGRDLDPVFYTARIPRLPGLAPVPDDRVSGSASGSRFREVLGGSQ